MQEAHVETTSFNTNTTIEACLCFWTVYNHGGVRSRVFWHDSSGAGGSCQHGNGKFRGNKDWTFHTTSPEKLTLTSWLAAQRNTTMLSRSRPWQFVMVWVLNSLMFLYFEGVTVKLQLYVNFTAQKSQDKKNMSCRLFSLLVQFNPIFFIIIIYSNRKNGNYYQPSSRYQNTPSSSKLYEFFFYM